MDLELESKQLSLIEMRSQLQELEPIIQMAVESSNNRHSIKLELLNEDL